MDSYVELEKSVCDDGIDKVVVGAIIWDADGRVLMLRRNPDDFMGGLLELPSGGREEGESLGACLRREIYEETGVCIAPEELIRYIDSFDYASQSGRHTRQFNFSIALHGDRPEIRLQEHCAYQWMVPEDIACEMSISRQTRHSIAAAAMDRENFTG